MKKIALFLLLATGTLCQAQTDEPTIGTHQLTLGILNNSGTLIYKTHLDRTWSTRYQVGTQYNRYGYYRYEGNIYTSYDLNASYTDRKNLNTYARIGKQRNHDLMEKVQLFYGADVGISHGYDTQYTYYPNDPDNLTSSKYKNPHRMGLSLTGILGVNYALTPAISLGLERQLASVEYVYNTEGQLTQIQRVGNDFETETIKTDARQEYNFRFGGSTFITATIQF